MTEDEKAEALAEATADLARLKELDVDTPEGAEELRVLLNRNAERLAKMIPGARVVSIDGLNWIYKDAPYLSTPHQHAPGFGKRAERIDPPTIHEEDSES